MSKSVMSYFGLFDWIFFLYFVIFKLKVFAYTCICKHVIMVTTCLKNLEMSGNLTAVREMPGILRKSRGNIREKLPKSVCC